MSISLSVSLFGTTDRLIGEPESSPMNEFLSLTLAVMMLAHKGRYEAVPAIRTRAQSGMLVCHFFYGITEVRTVACLQRFAGLCRSVWASHFLYINCLLCTTTCHFTRLNSCRDILRIMFSVQYPWRERDTILYSLLLSLRWPLSSTISVVIVFICN